MKLKKKSYKIKKCQDRLKKSKNDENISHLELNIIRNF